MKKTLFLLIAWLISASSFASVVLSEGFEVANHDMTPPIGWNCDDQSWLCGYLDKDHNRTAHTGDWYAFTNADDSWMFMSTFLGNDLRYRFYFWGISDGEYDVEFWAGDGPSANEMVQLLFTKTVHSNEYEEFSEYIQDINTDGHYLGIRAIAHEGAYHLTIDDITIEMVSKYDLDVTPSEFETVMAPGERITIKYDVANTGYEDLFVSMTPYSEFFGDISFTIDGSEYSPFPTVPNQVVHCTCSATLLPNVAVGSRCFMDIMFTVSCDCLTRMATLWVTVGDSTTDITEHDIEPHLFPNPTNDLINVSAEGLKQVEVIDMAGRTIFILNADQDLLQVNLTTLTPGVYMVKIISEQEVSFQKIVKQ